MNNSNLNLLIQQIASNKKYTHKCIVGDFNYRKINWIHWSTPCDESSDEEKFLEALRDSYYYQHVLEPTRARGVDEPSLLDLILTGEENQVSDLEYLAPLGKSDHSVLSFTFDCYIHQEISPGRYNFTKANFGTMRETLEESDWVTIYQRLTQTMSVEESWSVLKNKMVELRNQYVPHSKSNTKFWGQKGGIAIGSRASTSNQR